MKNTETTDTQPNAPPPPKIEHLVISGGGIGGLCLYGAMKASHERGEWDINDIKSIWGVSAGTILAVIIAMKYDFETMKQFFINFSMHRYLKMSELSFMSVFYTCGMFGREAIEKLLTPIFEGGGYDTKITMREFCAQTGVELHFFCTELLTDTIVEMTAELTPDLCVIDAIYRSSSVPFLFIPQRGVSGQIYLDGYLTCNYPTRECLAAAAVVGGAAPPTEENTLGFLYINNLNSVNNLIDLVVNFIFRSPTHHHIKHEYVLPRSMAFDEIYSFIKSAEKRREIFECGEGAERRGAREARGALHCEPAQDIQNKPTI